MNSNIIYCVYQWDIDSYVLNYRYKNDVYVIRTVINEDESRCFNCLILNNKDRKYVNCEHLQLTKEYIERKEELVK